MNTANIDKIRQLLALYYEARTNPEQEQQLTDYLLAEEQLPAELQDDAQLFRAMCALKDRNLMPAEFEQRLIAATCGREKPRRRARFLYWSGVAAAVVALAIVVVHRQPQSEPSVLPSVEIQATVSTVEEAVKVPNEYIAGNEVAVEQPVDVEPSPYIEISTPDSAAIVVGNLFGRLGRILASADRAASLPSEIIDNTLTTINTIRK